MRGTGSKNVSNLFGGVPLSAFRVNTKDNDRQRISGVSFTQLHRVDFDGDGKADVAVYDAQDGWWLFHYSSGGYFYDHIEQGGTGYGGVPGDYDGDGVTDIAVYNETNGYWYIKYSSGGYGFDSLGGTGSIPVNPMYLFGLVF